MAADITTGGMQDDLWKEFSSIPYAGGSSLVSHMLEIQDCLVKQPRSFHDWQDFTCLSTIREGSTSASSTKLKQVLFRSKPSIADGDFVAISYRWRETCQSGSYHIAAGQGMEQKSSQAPDDIMDRVLKYVKHFDLSAFWIDQECIDQHESGTKERAMQSMDLVYRCSKYPLGLLTTPLRRQSQINLLHQLLRKEFVVMNDSDLQLAHWLNLWKARKLLNLLVYLMADPWWKRRWIFQEEYCSSGKMQLLIPHATGIEKKNMQETLGAISGEVLIEAADFRKQVTLFCLACFQSAIFRTCADRRRCTDILRKAKTYRLLPKYGWIVRDDSLGRAMSTRILGDICRRTSKKPEDTLAILANCCGYTVRLDSQKLGASSESLSVAIIAMFLLNGEILWNDRRQMAAGTVFDLLKGLSFNEFDPPTDKKRLTFMKKCRLVNVCLTKSGIKTPGHLWCVQKEIRTEHFRLKHHQRTDNEEGACLHRFAAQLERSHPQLAENLHRYKHETISESWNEYGLQEIYRKMVLILDEAVLAGKKLLVARLVGSSQHWAIFVSPRRATLQPSFVFTAYESAEYSEIVKRYRSAVKYVSLLVSMHARTAKGLPRLQIEGWVNGLPFPEKKSPTEVIFSWPDALERLIIS